ncbi:tRNA lysidine(34) synthetase TilS [Thermovibrio sp.]
MALSGGPDSVSLLSLLLELRKELSITLEAVHVNHLLRGSESFRDEDFVRELCQNLKVPLTVKRVNVPEVSKGRNVEAVARELRYKSLLEVLSERKGDLIALGHTSSDLLETVLLNLTKGAGLKGLRGFLPKRGPFIRPLFEVSREEVEAYLREKGLPFVLDSSNLNADYERNLVRLKVVPHLRKINPKVEEAVLRSCETLRELEDFVESFVKPVVEKYLKGSSFKAPIKELLSLHPFLRKEIIRRAYREVSGRELSFKKVKELLSLIEREGYKEFVPDEGFKVIKEQDYLTIAPFSEKKGGFFYEVKELPFKVETPYGTLTFKLNAGAPVAPLASLSKGIIVRTRRPGDRLKFKAFSKPLKKFFIEKRVPASRRQEVPVVEVGGEIVYIPGLYRRELSESGDFVGVEFEPRS